MKQCKSQTSSSSCWDVVVLDVVKVGMGCDAYFGIHLLCVSVVVCHRRANPRQFCGGECRCCADQQDIFMSQGHSE